MCSGRVPEKVLLSAVMLNMLIMLNVFELTDSSRCKKKTKKKLHSTLQLREAYFFKNVLLSAEMLKCWMCSWKVPEKCASFSCNIEYVDYVECFWTYRPFQVHPRKIKQHSTLQFWEAYFSRMCFFQLKCWICWMCSWNVFENVFFFSGGMLNMLNMLNAFGTYRLLLNEANKFQKHSTYSTFPQKEAYFGRETFKHIQHIQHFRRKKHIFWKWCFFQL